MPAGDKRAGDDEVDGGAKKKIAGSSRTGQACDRCKVRKIRCDARVGGCSPCLQNNSECKTTDRITGRATSRGYTENIENENGSLKMYMVELQQQLRDHGIEPKQAPTAQPRYMPSQAYWDHNEQQEGSWGDLSTGGILPGGQSGRHGSYGSVLPEFRPGCIGDNYLGVSYDHNLLSSIEGTSLALFGTKIDIADFLPPDSDQAISPLSYQTFVSYAFRRTPQPHEPPLPPYDQLKMWADFYFKSVQVFTPVLHRPDFMNLLARRYHRQEVLSAPEHVMLHMVYVIMMFQYSYRGGGEQSFAEAISHFHYAITFVPDLIAGHTLQDIQALALICQQLRSQPKPGAAWMFTDMVLGLAIELGLHRSANAWQGPAAERDPHHNEMRKRVFWSLMCLHISVGGKLGRPMPLRQEDFDIELPEAVPDILPSETNVTKWRKCSFRAGVSGLRLLQIQMQVYATVYSIRSGSEPYDLIIQNLDKQLLNFKESLPPELSCGPETVAEDRCPALYLKATMHGFRLLLHHPALCRSTSPQIVSNNLDVCLESSRHILDAVSEIKSLKSLDTTWHFSTEYLAAIFTTLFVYTHRQDQLGAADLHRLRQDMETWLDIMGEVGGMLGSGPRLQEALRSIIDSSIHNISRHLAAKTASAGLASAESPTEANHHPQRQSTFNSANGYANPYDSNAGTPHAAGVARAAYPLQERGAEHIQHQTPYPSGNNFYPEPQHANMASYSSASSIPAFDTSTYNAEDMKPHIQAQLDPQNVPTPHQHQHPPPQHTPQHTTPQIQQISETPHHQAPSNFMAAFQPSLNAQSGFHAPPPVDAHNSGPAAWRNFTDNMMTNMNGQEYMNSANALMALQNDKQHEMALGAANINPVGGIQMAADQQTWPMIHFNGGPGNGQ